VANPDNSAPTPPGAAHHIEASSSAPQPAVPSQPEPASTQPASTHSAGAQSASQQLTKHLSFDEYKLYYESAERVTDRRLDLNKWNYSVMTATLLAIGAVLVWATQRADHELTGCVGVFILSLMAFLHCTFWIKQIDDFKALNTEKFRILNEMAPQVTFPDTAGTHLGSYEPFRREWRAMEADDAVREIRSGLGGRFMALKSSSAEYTMARIFRLAFLLIALAIIGLAVADYGNISAHLSPFGLSTDSTN